MVSYTSMGLERLCAVDASIRPNIVRGNTNLTCIMLGERVAAWMRADTAGVAVPSL